MGISDFVVQGHLKTCFMHFFLNTETEVLPHCSNRYKNSAEIFQITPIKVNVEEGNSIDSQKKKIFGKEKKPHICSLCSLKNIILTVSADWPFFWYNSKNES